MSTINNKAIDKIGQRIKEFRKKEGLTLVQLSSLIGISHGSLSGLENGKSKPSAETLSNFCLNTDIDMAWLLTGDGSKKTAHLLGGENKFEILRDTEEWLNELVRTDPGRKIWFELQLLDSFPGLKEWREIRNVAMEENETYKKHANSGRGK